MVASAATPPRAVNATPPAVRSHDAALDARDAAEEARAKAERQLSQSIDSVKDGAKGALSQLQRDAKTDKDNAVKKAVDDVKVECIKE